MSLVNKGSYQFGDFQLNLDLRVLTRSGERMPLGSKGFDVLTCLVLRAGEVVTKAELFAAVWQNSFVEEGTLSQQIFTLRKAFADKADYIATVPGKGYRFMGEVRHMPPIPHLSAGGWDVILHETRERSQIVLEEPMPQVVAATASSSRIRTRTVVAASLVAVALMVAGWALFHRQAPRDHVSVVVADFSNTTGDGTFDQTLKRALEIDLDQSPFIDVLGEGDGVGTLRRMGLQNDTAVTPAIAREICERDNRQAMLAGGISKVGEEYLVTLEATDCASGKRLASAKMQVASKNKVLFALDSDADRVRAKLGESSQSISTHQVPIEQATTPSLEALKAYSMGLHLEAIGKVEADAMSFFQRAVDLDPNFAMAWGALANGYGNMSETALSSQYYQKAFALSHHLDGLEMLTLEAHYYNGGIHDMQRAIKTFQLWAVTYPQDWVPWQNLCNDYNEMGLRQEAMAAGEQALRLDQTRENIYNVLIRAYKIAGRYKDAERLGEEAVRRGLDHDAIHAFLFEAAIDSHDSAALERETKYGETRGDWFFVYARARTEASVGKIHQANASFERSREIAKRENLDETADSILVDQAQLQYDLGLSNVARATMARIQQSYPDDPDLARLHAELGDIPYAQRFLQAQQSNTADTLLNAVALPKLRAVLALKRRKPLDAVAALEPARLYGKYEHYVLTERGTAYMQAGRPDLAANEYKAVLASAAGTDAYSPLYNLAHLALARAYAAQGQLAESRDEYARFLELWAGADADAPLLQQAKLELSHLRGTTSVVP
jgi:DNA-binding winged helix-turn-helix (wHTH) protein/tetratricopeptide (TPR) repeat protein